ncbi:rhomboid family intramembrane serine protease [Flavobacteriales bacterium]|nr:rhomboid family intramembrane serine protease [Flavobacteriales bacterium]
MNQKVSIFQGMSIPFLLIVIIWGIHFINISFPSLNLYTYGVLPREISGLKGILFSPFLHSTNDYFHIFNNSAPLFVLTYFFMVSYKPIFTKVIIFIWLFSGICVWLAARGNYHIGASGVIYGLAFFLFFSGIFSKNKRLIAISLIIVFLYGSLIWGIFPTDERVSWEGHLFGGLSGVIMAFYYKNRFKTKEKYNFIVNPEFEEFVDEYNTELKLQEEESQRIKEIQTNNTLDENYKIFFEYISKKKDD